MNAEQKTAWRGDVSMQTTLNVQPDALWYIGAVPTAGTQSLQPPGATVGQLALHMIVINFAEPLNTKGERPASEMHWEISGHSFRVNGVLKGRSGGVDGKAKTVSL